MLCRKMRHDHGDALVAADYILHRKPYRRREAAKPSQGILWTRMFLHSLCADSTSPQISAIPSASRHQICPFRNRATSAPAEGPACVLHFARHCEFPLRALQAQKWHIYRSSAFGAAWSWRWLWFSWGRINDCCRRALMISIVVSTISYKHVIIICVLLIIHVYTYIYIYIYIYIHMHNYY